MDIIAQIKADRAQARRLGDSNADVCFFALAEGGTASVRTLVLRDIDREQFTLFINSSSPKWQALSNGASYQLLLWYPTMQRQYRVSGSFTALDPEVIANNWHRRPLGSKFLDYVYEEMGDQSTTIPSRDVLTDKVAELKTRYRDEDAMQVPGKAMGLVLTADTIECLDLNSKDRIHDRKRYQRNEQSWQVDVLIP